MYCQHAKKGWALVLVLVLLVSLSGLTFAAKPVGAASLTIANEDFATTLSEGETYTFEVTARYKGSGSLNWDLSENLSMVGGPVSKGVNVSATLVFSGQSAGFFQESVIVTDGTVSDTLYATFTVEGGGPVNEAPVVEDLTLTTDEDTPVTGTLVATDPEGGSLTARISGTPAHGFATVDGLAVTYTPDENFNGQDAFEVTVTDSGGATDTGTVSITVDPVDDPPVAVDDQATTDVMTSITIDVLANDRDVDGGDLWIEEVLNATGGTAINNGSNVTFTPVAAGTGGFDYQLNGGSTAHVTVTIEPVTTAPTRYVALGDSIPYGVYNSSLWNYLFGGTDTDSYVEQLSRYLSVASGDFIDASVSGHNTVDVLYQIDSLSGPIAGADVITLCVGANDIMDAAGRSYSGLEKYNIDWSVADTGRDHFELYWPQVIDKIEGLNPDVTLVVMTVYNPYRQSDSYYNLVDPYFSNSTGTDLGMNHIIQETMALDNTLWGDRIADGFDYRVVDVYTTYNSFGDQKDYLTNFYSSFCDPHPNQAGQDVIFDAHTALTGDLR